jgi:hypothetical protein
VVLIRRSGARRWLIGVAVALTIVVTACLVIGFTIPPAARTDELPQSIAVDGVAHERVHLVTLKTAHQDSTAVQVPMTSQPIVVRASCRLALLHTSRARSAIMLELVWMRTGGDVASIPDTKGTEILVCPPDRGPELVQTIDPAWLPRDGQRLQLRWHELPTLADTPSDSPTSWALAVYVAR